jgi:hypothetical protein
VRSTVAESVTQQVRMGIQGIGRDLEVIAEAVPLDPWGLSPEHGVEVGPTLP